MKLSNRLSQKFKKLKEDFAGFPKSLSNEINKHKKLILTVALSGGVTLASFSQQDPNHPDNTYLSTEQLDVWTTNAAAQAEFDTPEERQNFIWREALVQYNALHGGHKDLAHYVPHQHSTEITTEITESGNLDTDASNYVNKVADGTMSSLAGALHILRPYGSNIRGTSVPNDLNDRRFIALNMDMATLRTKAHEFAHTFNGALCGGNHDNAMSNVFSLIHLLAEHLVLVHYLV